MARTPWKARISWKARLLALPVVLLLVGSSLAAVQLARSDRAPDFRRGGPFGGAEAGELDAAPSPLSPRPPRQDAGHGMATATDATSTTAVTADGSGTGDGAGDTDPGTDENPATTETAQGSVSALPRLGTYRYEVDGWEEATGFGRRDYPEEMTLTAHRDADDVGEDEVVFDLEFSDRHEEREIVAYTDAAIAFTFEGGSVTFGPRTETSEADYRPPMTQTPLPLAVGATRQGTSEAVDSDGDVVRTEDWTVEVQGRETLTIAGESVHTWAVTIDRTSRPGSSEKVERHRTYWYDPHRHIWVRWHETLHGERGFGPVTFTYDTEYTATLQDFAPR